MALYQNGILISGANKLPQMTYAEWQALPASERPSDWICTDRSYSDLPASDVAYDNTDSGLSADNIQDAIDEVAQSSGGGHIIQDASGTDMTQRANMQFADSHVSDDSTNDKTEVEVIKSVASADYSSETEDGLYLLPDGDGSVIEPASEDYVEVKASSDTYKTALNKLRNGADFDKITKESYIKFGNNVYIVTALLNNEIYFSSVLGYAGSGGSNIQTIFMPKRGVGNCSFQECVFTSSISRTNKDESSVTDGTKITLHYGNKKAVVDLQTTANRCLMPDGTTTVSDALTYSTTAKKIGTFLGRNLYRKVFEYTEVNVPINTDVKLTGSVGIVTSKIVRMSTVLRQSGSSTITNSPVLQTYITDSNEMWINQGMSSSYNSATITVIVEYTD